ncbi:MAG: peptidyl-prolyl cis-trans isomerase, partial [Planctomycetota bacterium]
RLTPEQQVGFRGFLEAIRQDLLSQNYGSRQIAGRRLEERAGLTEDEFIEQQRQTQLIQATLRDQIGNRVSVSWRDIVQRYQRDIDVFKPDPAALYRIIRVRDDDVEEVKRRLAAGEPFEEIAAEPFNSFERETQGQRRVTFSGERGEADLFGGPLNEIAQQLELGEVSEPLVIGSSTYWMRLEGVQAEEISLYDAQLEIAGLIESERTQEELNRFIQRMVERADIGTLDSIRRGLLVIAAERFAPPPGPPGGSSAGSPRGR